MQKLIVLSPVYNDWQSYRKLLANIHALETLHTQYEVEYLCVNDGSTEFDYYDEVKRTPTLQILNLHRNNGHQKAIAVGIAFITTTRQFDYLAIMDSDGEDSPLLLLELLTISNPNTIVLAKRKKRKDSFLFLVFYRLYKLIFYVLTGKKISFGNFSVLPFGFARKLIHDSDLWINYSSCILNNKVHTTLVNTNKSERYFGKSKMNFQSLLLHGLGAISIHIERVTARMLVFTTSIGLISIIGIFIIIYIRLFTDTAVPGWATNFILSLVLIIVQSIIMGLLLTFIILNRKTQKLSTPIEDFKIYINNE